MKKRCLCVLLAVLMLLSTTVLPIPVRGASSMSVSGDMISVLKVMEGFSARVYWDYAQWTVGYGTKCPDDKVEYYKKNDISEEYALELLAQAVDRFEADVNSFIDRHGLILNQHQFDALVSFSYNCGSGWMSETTGYFNTAVREGGSASELIYGMCLYSTAGGEYVLTGRRLCEANMYLNGVYKAYNADSQGNPDNLKYIFLDGNGGDVRYTICGFDANAQGPISVAFQKIPTGVDSSGNPFAYTLEGWYTAEGKKVDKLDSSLSDGQVLYARWTDPEGKAVSLPKGEAENLTVTVTSSSVNVRSGPATFYNRVGSYTENTSVSITEVYKTGDYVWGKTDLGWFRLDYSNYESLKSDFPKNGTITGDGVNYRTEPVFANNVVGRFPKGHRVTITDKRYSAGMWWGKMDNGYWVSLDYVQYDSDVKKVTGVTLLKEPTQLDYVQKTESLKLEGSVILVRYDDGSTTAMTLNRSMVTSFKNTTLGTTVVTATYEGYAVQFRVAVIKATVTFRNWDGTVLSSNQYAYGETVTQPPAPTREPDGAYYYVFSGWDKEVNTCAGNATYTAVYVQSTDPDAVVVPEGITSDKYTLSQGYIRKIPTGTTVDGLIGGIHESSYITVYNGNTQVNGASPVATGMTVKLIYENRVIATATAVVTGDVSGDGGITITDMLNVKSQILGKSALTGAYAQAADTNGDGTVSITDFIQIKAKILGKSNITPN